ncbi:tail fiber assembly protein [Aeromonas hydrophila]|uniref:tail fiber assembly protein n=1 Tax=Aeromonas hydrophila TaxID=644 RepID=UPI0007601A98|nr:tail fiber assembly protein [Aeromonas hydrophila]KWR67740.1 phage tail protein [Aeromonas hydrophila]HAU4931283.1 tail fiber assembly protein [Aeromonas hydrophila]
MAILFSRTLCFIDTNFYEPYPDDCVEISVEKRDELLRGQADGLEITANTDGYPILIEPTAPPLSEIAMAEQAARIANANQQIAILKPAVDGGYAKPEHPQLLADWQRCRYELTLVPEQPGWPDKPQWPDQPATVI